MLFTATCVMKPLMLPVIADVPGSGIEAAETLAECIPNALFLHFGIFPLTDSFCFLSQKVCFRGFGTRIRPSVFYFLSQSCIFMCFGTFDPYSMSRYLCPKIPVLLVLGHFLQILVFHLCPKHPVSAFWDIFRCLKLIECVPSTIFSAFWDKTARMAASFAVRSIRCRC